MASPDVKKIGDMIINHIKKKELSEDDAYDFMSAINEYVGDELGY